MNKMILAVLATLFLTACGEKTYQCIDIKGTSNNFTITDITVDEGKSTTFTMVSGVDERTQTVPFDKTWDGEIVYDVYTNLGRNRRGSSIEFVEGEVVTYTHHLPGKDRYYSCKGV